MKKRTKLDYAIEKMKIRVILGLFLSFCALIMAFIGVINGIIEISILERSAGICLILDCFLLGWFFGLIDSEKYMERNK